jgi:hypothetical protein
LIADADALAELIEHIAHRAARQSAEIAIEFTGILEVLMDLLQIELDAVLSA